MTRKLWSPGSWPPPPQREAGESARLNAFVNHLLAGGRRAVLTPSAYAELLHTSIRLQYLSELRNSRQAIAARYGRRISSWTELYKRDAEMLARHSSELRRLHARLVLRGIVLVTPEDLGSPSLDRPWHDEMIDYIHRYRLDTTDALILMEASRLGISAIVTMDRDMERALPNFDVYLWR